MSADLRTFNMCRWNPSLAISHVGFPFQLLSLHSWQDTAPGIPKSSFVSFLSCLPFGNPGLQLLGRGAGPTPLPRYILSLGGLGRQTLGVMSFTTSSFPLFSHPKYVTAFSYYHNRISPPALTHQICEFSPFPTADVPSKS